MKQTNNVMESAFYDIYSLVEAYQKNSLVRFPIPLNSWVKSYARIFHEVISCYHQLFL